MDAGRITGGTSGRRPVPAAPNCLSLIRSPAPSPAGTGEGVEPSGASGVDTGVLEQVEGMLLALGPNLQDRPDARGTPLGAAAGLDQGAGGGEELTAEREEAFRLSDAAGD